MASPQQQQSVKDSVTETSGNPPTPKPGAALKLTARDVNFFYGAFQALYDISLDIPANKVTAFIGPSGCGKSTFLRTMNRMNETIRNTRVEGELKLDNEDLFSMDVTDVRRRVGMVFQKSNPFPKSVYENVVYGLRLQGVNDKVRLDEAVERSLRGAALWEEVRDRLHTSALGLSVGQQQRLCIARAIAVEPEIILMDEPCSALDPIATVKVEELIHQLKQNYTIVIVTHNMQQAGRCSDITAFFYMGRLIEIDATGKIFTNPSQKQTEDYISGRFG